MWYIFQGIVTAILSILAVNLILNLRTLHQLGKDDGEEPEELPLISVLIPARNEARNIIACLDSLLSVDLQFHANHVATQRVIILVSVRGSSARSPVVGVFVVVEDMLLIKLFFVGSHTDLTLLGRKSGIATARGSPVGHPASRQLRRHRRHTHREPPNTGSASVPMLPRTCALGALTSQP